jgi:c(7)-type cytochrome triheme protein
MRELRLLLALLAFVTFLVLAGCNFITGNANGKAVDSKAAIQDSEQSGIYSIPCFKCHPVEKFLKDFPHDLHRTMGLHCTQCHILKSHREISLNGNTCQDCHNLSTMEMKTSAMPVTFNHGGHLRMFDCNDCHRDVFPMKLNEETITMERINRGDFCGKCHNGNMAFSSADCNRCHAG